MRSTSSRREVTVVPSGWVDAPFVEHGATRFLSGLSALRRSQTAMFGTQYVDFGRLRAFEGSRAVVVSTQFRQEK